MRLSFRRRVLPNEVFSVSAEALDGAARSTFDILLVVSALGPVNLLGLGSAPTLLGCRSVVAFSFIASNSLFDFGKDADVKGETVLRGGFISIAFAACVVEIPGIRKCAPSDLRLKCELLVRRWDGIVLSSCEVRRVKKFALEAVMGVLGVFCAPRLGGGVVGLRSSFVLECARAAILSAVGSLAGSRFNGGSRIGCKVRLPFCAPEALSSPSSRCIAEALVRCRSTTAFGVSLSEDVDEAAEGFSIVETLVLLLASNCRLDLRGMKLKGTSCSFFGDSYALGIAGTGGTPSSDAVETTSFLLFNVGNRDAAKFWSDLVLPAFGARMELRLALEDTEIVELMDFRLGSGVVRLDDGVSIFLGI